MDHRDLSVFIAIFEDVASALHRPGNDFAWSGWNDESEALREIEAVLAQLRGGSLPVELDMKVLFAPTGPIQEVSISSGWGDEFLVLAERFDGEVARFAQTQLSRRPPQGR